MSFEDRVGEVVQGILSDSTQLPAEFISSLPQIVAQNPVATAHVSGDRIAIGTTAGSVSTAGTTFGTGADILSTALQFTATGSNSYILRVLACDWFNNGANRNQLNLNLDGADGGFFCSLQMSAANAAHAVAAAAYFQPSGGSHSVNARLVVNAGTGTVEGGAGGVGVRMPIIVTLEVA